MLATRWSAEKTSGALKKQAERKEPRPTSNLERQVLKILAWASAENTGLGNR